MSRTTLALLLVSTFVVAACGPQAAPASPSGWLRTYQAQRTSLCPSSEAVEPVVGRFGGDATAEGDKSWLTAPDGKRLYVVWPEGFSLSFERGATLRDERGEVVAADGSAVTLPQVNQFDHSGTLNDPYVALGSLFGRCYGRR